MKLGENLGPQLYRAISDGSSAGGKDVAKDVSDIVGGLTFEQRQSNLMELTWAKLQDIELLPNGVRVKDQAIRFIDDNDISEHIFGDVPENEDWFDYKNFNTLTRVLGAPNNDERAKFFEGVVGMDRTKKYRVCGPAGGAIPIVGNHKTLGILGQVDIDDKTGKPKYPIIRKLKITSL